MSVEQTRAKILEITTKLLVDKGEQATSMSLISKMSHVSIGSIYNLFSSKEELITAAYCDCRDHLLGECFDIPFSSTDSAKDTLKRMNRAYLKSALNHPYEFKFLMQYHLSPIIDPKVFITTDFPISHSNQTLTYLIQQGVLKNLSPTILDLICFGIINQLVKAHYAGFIQITSDIEDSILDACWDAISASYENTN